MRLREIIRAPKSEIEIGKWRAGKVPKSDFPLFKNAYNLGSAFKWNVITFQALGAECRVLVVFNAGKQKYEAILGVMGSRGINRIKAALGDRARISENVLVSPQLVVNAKRGAVGIPGIKFREIAVQMLLAAVLINTLLHAALEDRTVTFDRVG